MEPIWHFKLPHKLVDREGYILSTCQGKKVLHLGCVDYPITSEQVKSERWLHAKLMQVAKDVTGVDNNDEGVQYLRSYGYSNIVYGNAEELATVTSAVYEIIVAGEIIEHLSNPGAFLNSARSVMGEESVLIISTTNAFCLRRFLRVPFGTESVHPDHVYYFSHATLSALLKRYGFTVLEAAAYRLSNKSNRVAHVVETVASFISPNLCEGIIYRAKKV